MANLIEYIQSQIYENSTEDISGSIMQQVLTRMASDEGVVNVHTISGQTPFADYNNAQAARNAVPDGFKKLGLIITYKLSSGWYIDEFIGSATSGWSTASNWKCLGPISVSQNASTGKTTITIGSESFDVATQPVSVSQNTSTGKQELSIGGEVEMIVNNIETQNDNNIASSFVIGNTIIPHFPFDNAFVNRAGQKTASSGYHCTDFIRVAEGQIIHFKGNGSAAALLLSCYTDATEASFMNNVNTYVDGTETAIEKDFTIPRGAKYIRLSGWKSADCSISGVNFLIKSFYELEKNSADIWALINGGTFPINIDINGYVAANGTLVETNTEYRRSRLIPVYEGQEVSVICNASSGVLVISAYADNDFSSFIANSSINTLGGDSEQTYNITIPNGVKFICVSRNASVTASNTIIYKGFHSVESDMFGDETIVEFLNNAIVRPNGTYAADSTYRLSDFIKVKEGEILDFTSQGSSSVLLLSAYSSNNQSSFISDSELNIVGDDYGALAIKVVVPSGVNYIRIGKHQSYTSGIYVPSLSLQNQIDMYNGRIKRIEDCVGIYETLPKFKSTSPRKPCIVFQMDWDWRAGATYQNYKNTLKKYGIDKSLYALRLNFFPTDLESMKEVYSEGNEIALHTDGDHSDISNNSTLTVAEFNELMGTYHKEMAAEGFEYFGCVVLSTNLKSTFFEPISKIHNWTIAGPVDIEPMSDADYITHSVMNTASDFRFPKRLGMELTTEQYADPTNETLLANKLIDAIDYTIENNGFLILYCHSYMATSYPYTLRENVLVPVLQHLKPLLEKGQCLTGRTTDLLEYYFTKRFDE